MVIREERVQIRRISLVYPNKHNDPKAREDYECGLEYEGHKMK